MSNFGLRGGDRGSECPGINSKLSELHAAVGLCLPLSHELEGEAVRRIARCALENLPTC